MLPVKVLLLLAPLATLTSAWRLTVYYDYHHPPKSIIKGDGDSGCKLLPVQEDGLTVNKVKLEAKKGETWGVVLYTDEQCLYNPVSVPMGEVVVPSVELKTYFLFRVGPQ